MNFIDKAFALNIGCNAIILNGTISNMLALGRTANQRSQNKNSCKMRAYFWPWLVLSLAYIIRSLEF